VKKMGARHSPQSDESPSLIDDVTFLSELEKRGGATAPATRPGHARRPGGAIDPVIPRDVNRWDLHPPPGVGPEPTVRHRPSSGGSAFLPILIGLCAGAAGAAVVFHERLVQVIALFRR
jgi:hypothetical protein